MELASHFSLEDELESGSISGHSGDQKHMRFLVVEDDLQISQTLCQSFQEIGVRTDTAFDGKSGLDLACKYSYDLVILDLMLPEVDGLTLIENARARGVESKILILSAKRSVDERVIGLQKGGDDYLTKPFAISELIARCQALLRRPSQSQTPILVRGTVSMNLMNREVLREGQRIDLQAKEFSLLEFFMRNPNRAITKEEILETIWNYKFDPGTNVVDVLVFRLRNKIDKNFDKRVIQTRRGIGYVFKPV